MRAPTLRATIERRILINYRVDVDALTALVPPPFRPALIDGHGIAGICLIRLGGIRPNRLPASLGMTTENAAHRIAVCWDAPDGPVTGVYIPRRDTSSRLAAIAGGRVFPGWQHLARFRVEEHDDRYRIEVDSGDGTVHITVAAHGADQLPPGSVFANIDAASQFFRCAPLGYAATPTEGTFDGVELGTDGWALQPLRIDEVSSSFFDDPDRFPAGTTHLDSAFLMEGLATTWHPQPKLHAPAFIGDAVSR